MIIKEGKKGAMKSKDKVVMGRGERGYEGEEKEAGDRGGGRKVIMRR